MTDPRTERAAKDLQIDGRWEGLRLDVHDTNQPWIASHVGVLGESVAGGRRVATFTIIDRDDSIQPALLTGYQGNPHQFDSIIPLTNNDAVIANPFYRPNLGPLAIALIDKDKNIISDVVGGLGLPDGHHMSFEATFRRRDSRPDAPDSDLAGEVKRLSIEVDRLSREWLRFINWVERF